MVDEFPDSTLEITLTTQREQLRLIMTPGQALLIVLAGARVGHRLVLTDQTCTIGRGSAATLQLEGDAVSRIHARIESRAGVHYLVDCESTNGSFVNYTRVKDTALRDGDQIQIGHVLCKYLAGDNIETTYHEEFRRLVRRDALTGALNRATFDDELRIALTAAPRKGTRLCLILFDLDHFKRINDAHGHTAGDLALSAVAREVNEHIPLPHQFARVGGEEFAILYVGGIDAARAYAEEVRRLIQRTPVSFEGTHICVTASLGVAEWTGGASASVYEAADKQLYRAKDGGRNRVG